MIDSSDRPLPAPESAARERVVRDGPRVVEFDEMLAGSAGAASVARFDALVPVAEPFLPEAVAGDNSTANRSVTTVRPAATEDTGRTAAAAAGGSRGADPETDPDPETVARAICLRLLTDRARTRQELAQALHRKGVPVETAASVLERFDDVGLIDDGAFAEQWVRSRHAVRGLGRRALAVELRRKGVADDIAGQVLAGVDAAAEDRRARELVERKLRTLRTDTQDQRAAAARKLVGMLARKGYSGGVAYQVVREVVAAHGAELDELDSDPPADD